jgi:hypothetical protein
MGVSIYVAWAKDETSTELERVPAQSMLVVPARESASAGFCVVAAE